MDDSYPGRARRSSSTNRLVRRMRRARGRRPCHRLLHEATPRAGRGRAISRSPRSRRIGCAVRVSPSCCVAWRRPAGQRFARLPAWRSRSASSWRSSGPSCRTTPPASSREWRRSARRRTLQTVRRAAAAQPHPEPRRPQSCPHLPRQRSPGAGRGRARARLEPTSGNGPEAQPLAQATQDAAADDLEQRLPGRQRHRNAAVAADGDDSAASLAQASRPIRRGTC